MERINGTITNMIKSLKQPDENIVTVLELDAHVSLLPFVIPGMQGVLSRDLFSDKDGRLLMHKVYRHYVATGYFDVEAPDEYVDDDDEDIFRQRIPNNNRPVLRGPGKLPPSIVESFLTSEDPMFAMDREELEAEFGVKLTDADIRHAIRKVGDVNFVGRVHGGKKRSDSRSLEILDRGQYNLLKRYIKRYLGELHPGGNFDFLFVDGEPEDGTGTGPDALGKAGSLLEGRHHPAVKFTKWKIAMFENITKLADFRLDIRKVTIAGAMYDKKRKRSASFFEFSTDCSYKAGAHTVGNPLERASSHRSEATREFAEALFFMTVDFDWTKLTADEREHAGISSTSSLPRSFYLGYCRPFTTKSEGDLISVGRVRASDRIPGSLTRNRQYKKERWLDIDDCVDIVGLLYCREREYICWRDGSWDPLKSKDIRPLQWIFQDDNDPDSGHQGISGPQPTSRASLDGLGDADYESEISDIMRSWTRDSVSGSRRSTARVEREEDRSFVYGETDSQDEELPGRGSGRVPRSSPPAPAHEVEIKSEGHDEYVPTRIPSDLFE